MFGGAPFSGAPFESLGGPSGPVIIPTGIAGAEAFGTASLSPTVAPTGIASAEAIGTASIAAVISPAGIAGAEAFGAASISATIAPTGIVTGAAFGTASLAATIAPTGVAGAEAFGNTVVLAGTGIFPTGIVSAEAFGVPYIGMNPASVAGGEAFGLPWIWGAIAAGPSWSIVTQGRIDWIVNDGDVVLAVVRPGVVDQVLQTPQHVTDWALAEKPNADFTVSYLSPIVQSVLIH